jgi:hypothetical protein
MKPYRLINSVELEQIQARFRQSLATWNEQYSLHPLSLQVSIPDKDYIITQNGLIDSGTYQPIMLIDEGHQSLINYALFGVLDDDFNATSDKLMLHLFTQMLHSAPCAMSSNQVPTDWIYPGSTCLLLTFSCEQHALLCLLNPEWVYHLLSADKHRKPKALHTLDEALAYKQLTLSLELDAINIPFKQLMELQLGDVLVTDHKLAQPLNLIHEQKHVASTELGQQSEYKSVLLKEFL